MSSANLSTTSSTSSHPTQSAGTSEIDSLESTDTHSTTDTTFSLLNSSKMPPSEDPSIDKDHAKSDVAGSETTVNGSKESSDDSKQQKADGDGESEADKTRADGADEPKKHWKLEVERSRFVYSTFGQVQEVSETDSGTDNVADINEEGETILGNGGYIMKLSRYFTPTGAPKNNQITIRSPYVRRALQTAKRQQKRTILSSLSTESNDEEEEDEISTDGEDVIDEPYSMLFHNRHKMEQLLKTMNGEGKRHVQYFLDFLKTEFASICNKQADYQAGKLKNIDSSLLWLLYAPGQIVYCRQKTHWRAFQIESLKEGVRRQDGVGIPLSLNLAGAMFSNSSNTLKSMSKDIQVPASLKSGILSIADLTFVPEMIHPEREQIRQDLIERGREYWELTKGPQYRQYVGDAWPQSDNSNPVRVMVDMKRNQQDDSNDVDAGAVGKCTCDSCTTARERRWFYTEGKQLPGSSSSPQDEILALCPSSVPAFSMRQKRWALVELVDLKPVDFRKESFKRLVAEKEYKNLVHSVVKTYLDDGMQVKDIVQGKGQGLVILLCGPPGTGKTLTAECVAEEFQKPLYMITSGDLGVDAASLEGKLREAFELATRWEAVLLLDEADVFLADRDLRDLQRNALVSVFLRELEYFDGILFLTTNRPGLVDDAFQSRIHLSLPVPKLDRSKQARVWSIFLFGTERGKQLSDAEHDLIGHIMKYTEKDQLNGRQIRNHVMTASALAKQAEKAKPGKEEIEEVISIARRFTEFMNRVQKLPTEERASQMGYR